MQNNMEHNFPGLIIDSRTEEEKAKDYPHEELYGALPIVWVTKTPDSWKKFSIRDQDGSSSCVGQGTAKALEVMTGVIQSAHPTYRKRPNFSGKGMYLQAAGDILKNSGTTTEQLDPSQLMNEDKLNADVTCETPVKIGSYVFINPHDIDAIASVISDGKAVVLTFNSTYSEWKDVPVADPNSLNFWGHCVCAVDFTLYEDKKTLIIEDSWGHATAIGNGGQRIITEDYLSKRCTGAMYFLPVVAKSDKPIHVFNTNLVYGMSGNEVKALQQALIWDGELKAGLDTGYFGTLTLRAVMAFQTKYAKDILLPAGSKFPTGKVLNFTRQKLNELCRV